MTILYKIMLFYVVAGVIVGAVVATADVKFQFGEKEKRVWFPRLAAFVFCAVFWPVVFWSMILKGLHDAK